MNKTTPQKALAILDKITERHKSSDETNGININTISTTAVPMKNIVANGETVHQKIPTNKGSSISISDAARNKHVVKVTLISWFMW